MLDTLAMLCKQEVSFCCHRADGVPRVPGREIWLASFDAGGNRKELTCRCVARWCCSEKLGHCAVAGRRLVGDVSFLLEERSGLANDIADCGPADIAEGAGKDVQGAQSSLVEDGQQDAFTVADLLVEDAVAGAGLARAAAAFIGEAFGL